MTLQALQHGGIVFLLLIIIASVVFVLLVERFVYFHRQYINSDEFLSGVRNVLKRGSIVEALSICEATPGPVARLVKTAILHRSRSVEQLQNLLYVASLNETALLEKKLGALAAFVRIVPLLGFWGVILGLMDVFESLLVLDTPTRPDLLVAGMWKALICSGFGVAISIPGRLGHEFLIHKLQQFIVEIEKSMVEAIIILKESD